MKLTKEQQKLAKAIKAVLPQIRTFSVSKSNDGSARRLAEFLQKKRREENITASTRIGFLR